MVFRSCLEQFDLFRICRGFSFPYICGQYPSDVRLDKSSSRGNIPILLLIGFRNSRYKIINSFPRKLDRKIGLGTHPATAPVNIHPFLYGRSRRIEDANQENAISSFFNRIFCIGPGYISCFTSETSLANGFCFCYRK